MRPSVFARAAYAVVIVTFGAAIASAQTAPAQPTTVDPRWAPWLGCWQIIDESVRDAPTLADALVSLGRTRANAGALVCVTPATGGVTMTTFVNDEPVLTETVVADGTQRPLSESDCRGWQRGVWSTLGARLFADAEISCGDQAPRKVSGLSMMMLGPLWIDVQMIENEGTNNLRVRRYHRAANQKHAGLLPPAPRTPAVPLSSRLSIADVKEAVTKVAPEALQAAIFELKKGFDLTGERLIELDRAGVPDQIVDLMVAQSFPSKFVVEPNTSSGGSWGMSGFDSMWPYYSDPFFYTSYYAPFGYRYWGSYDPYYFRGPGFVVVNPQPVRPDSNGRVVDGRGYTRVRLNEPTSASGTGRGSTGASDGSGSGSSGSSGSSGGVSTSGYSSGGASGGGGGGRTAVSRPPG
jgi:hypothetical protein